MSSGVCLSSERFWSILQVPKRIVGLTSNFARWRLESSSTTAWVKKCIYHDVALHTKNVRLSNEIHYSTTCGKESLLMISINTMGHDLLTFSLKSSSNGTPSKKTCDSSLYGGILRMKCKRQQQTLLWTAIGLTFLSLSKLLHKFP